MPAGDVLAIHRVQDPLLNYLELAGRVQVFTDGDELVTSITVRDLCLPASAPQATCKLKQDLIPDVMAMLIVYRLESIDIHEQDPNEGSHTFEAAEGGTILLDEIGAVSMKVQTSLLRVIQEREVLRVGDSRVRKVDVRVVVATNRDLAQEVAAGRFREDLLYRIRVARIAVPPLRDRGEDIPLLVASFLAQQRLSTGRPVMEVEDLAMNALRSYRWPGNVRELKAAIEHAVIRCKGSAICLRDLPPELRGEVEAGCSTVGATAADQPGDESQPAASTTDKRGRILEALDWAEGNRARAARRLGISRATLYRRLRELGIPDKKA